MTPHQRILAAVAREPVDRFPFSTYNCHPFSWGSHRDAPGYGPILEKITGTSAACLCKVSAAAASASSDSESSQRVEGADTYTTVTWHTPLGPLTRVTRKPADQPGMCVKHFIEGAGDVKKYLGVPYAPARWDVSDAVAQAQEIGEKGVAYLSYSDPFYDVSDLFDQADFAIRTAEEFDFIRSLVEFQCGFDVLEPIEPPPQGNIDLAGLRQAAGGKVALMGYIQDQDFYLLTEEEMRGRVWAIADTIGEGTGFICCPTATPFQHPPTPTYVANYVAFLDEAQAAGGS